ncbi:MAG: hypothetical protein M3N24_06900 [Actinomycetota bacterium]|nr:hypothetical protein [Actinomycetota bacterium]
MEPREIFDLIVKADEALKYATAEKAEARSRQAREWLVQARDEATTIGNQALVDQANQRLSDLDRFRQSGQG